MDQSVAAVVAEREPDYVPPHPYRHETMPSVIELMGLARKNFLSIWSKGNFSSRLMSQQVLRRLLVVCNSPDVVQEAFQTNHAVLQRKSPQMRHALEPLIGDGLFISDSDIWRRRRKVVAPIIHGSRVPGFAPIMVDTIEEKRAEWAARGAGGEVDALAEMAHLTAEIICRTIFGRNLGRNYASEIVEGFSDYQRYIDQVDLPAMLGLPEWLPRFRRPAVHRSVKRILGVLDEIIDSYQAMKDSGEVSVIGGLLEARDEDGAPLSREAIRNEAAVIFMAGHETTANTLAWAWFLLSQAPRVRERLHAELDSVLGDAPPSFADVARLPYTKAVIEETLRLYPPVPILAREAMADTTVGGKRIPKGTILMVVPWLLHRNPTLWPDADAFRPERFLEGEGTRPSKYGYVPFSIGPRICAGLQFGLTESILSLAILARAFDLRLKPGADIQPVCRLTLRPGDALPMTLHPRTA
ncbi:cytochrome P450 [Polymorphum gilvum]|uniref:Cytochrome P450 n=1 Tax=Polymorphum gilvum (strain LMG 25793 / CGMCC 1.9160 / SL003B-26A1) TaxID=991905 RepID=F2IWQ5_POLGS|nr:cytochrome P450 [Polymorphum gilvum]ADZ70380.1 Cytochrome P450 [Polymorphum gilvum SL003B-26A1]